MLMINLHPLKEKTGGSSPAFLPHSCCFHFSLLNFTIQMCEYFKLRKLRKLRKLLKLRKLRKLLNLLNIEH